VLISGPPSGREHPHGQVQARRGGQGEHADDDRGAQHAMHSPQVYGGAARAVRRRAVCPAPAGLSPAGPQG